MTTAYTMSRPDLPRSTTSVASFPTVGLCAPATFHLADGKDAPETLWLHCLSGLEASAYLFRPLLQDGRLPRAGMGHDPLECYRDFRQKYAGATSQPFRRAAGVLRPVRARQD